MSNDKDLPWFNDKVLANRENYKWNKWQRSFPNCKNIEDWTSRESYVRIYVYESMCSQMI